MSSQPTNAFGAMNREDLLRALEMFAKNWLAHDGCWFLAAEERLGMETAIEFDAQLMEGLRLRRRIHDHVQHSSGWWACGPGKSLESAPLRRHKLAAHRMVRRPQASAFL